MSEPIQSIAQNNYILHNIDAKKLYVQEPLFTANSGDAVYVGWRPDETVLYSGSVKWDGTVPLSEPISSFNEIKVYMETQNDAAEYSLYYPGTTKTINAIIPKGDGNNDYLYNTRWTVGSTALSYYKTFIQSIGPNTQYKEVGIFEVIGINRKENA